MKLLDPRYVDEAILHHIMSLMYEFDIDYKEVTEDEDFLKTAIQFN